MFDCADDADPGTTLERGPQRAVAEEDELALAPLLEGTREAEDVLALGQGADAEKARPLGRQPTSARASAESRNENRSRSTPQSTTELFAQGLRHHLDQAVPEPGRHRDDRAGALDGRAGRDAQRPVPAGVLDVLPVRGDDERSAAADRSEKTGRDEEVRVDDVRVEAAAPLRTTSRARRA